MTPTLTGSQLFALDLLRAASGSMAIGNRTASYPATIASGTARALVSRGLVSIDHGRATLVERA